MPAVTRAFASASAIEKQLYDELESVRALDLTALAGGSDLNASYEALVAKAAELGMERDLETTQSRVFKDEVVFKTDHWHVWYHWNQLSRYQLTTLDIAERPLLRFDTAQVGSSSTPRPRVVVGPEDAAWARLPCGETEVRLLTDWVLREWDGKYDEMTGADAPFILAAFRAGCRHFEFLVNS